MSMPILQISKMDGYPLLSLETWRVLHDRSFLFCHNLDIHSMMPSCIYIHLLEW